MIVVIILQVVIVITISVIALNSRQFGWFPKSTVSLTKHVLSTILLQAPSLFGMCHVSMLRLLNMLLWWFCPE